MESKSRKEALTPADLKIAADAFEAAQRQLQPLSSSDENLLELRRQLASSVMQQVFAGEEDVGRICTAALRGLAVGNRGSPPVSTWGRAERDR